ncbi:MAG: hypothetical protein ACK5B9_11855 [Flavobacteriia bacterium]|jgi:antitoxin component YwqK of YwqJK toxin-antitoxin module
MKTIALLCFTFCYSFIAFNQDTLSCKKDLTWDKEHFYYKTGDASKQKYTGPAKCYPRKGVENRGYLKNGNWEGKVYGYKGNILLGYSFFQDGYFEGPTVRYYEESFDCPTCVKDSFVYNHSKILYSKIYKRSKYLDEIKSTSESFYIGDTVRITNLLYDNNIPSEIEKSTFVKGQKNGLFENSTLSIDSANKIEYFPIYKTFYQNNKLIYQKNYDGGYLYEAEYYDQKGKISKKIIYFGSENKIESETNYVNGKISGEVKHFDESGKLVSLEKYEKGKLIETIDY